MKNSFLRVASVFLTIITVAGVFYGCSGAKQPNEGIDTITDRDGITYLAIVDDKDGHILAGVTDENGRLYAAETDALGNVLKDGNLYDVNYVGELPTNDTTAVSINESQNVSYDYANQDVIVDANHTTAAPQTTSGGDKSDATQSNSETTEKSDSSGDKTTQAAPEEYLAEKYKTLFQSQTYYIEFTTDDESASEPITLAVKNGNIYMKTKFENMNCTMIYQKKKDSVYIVLSDYRVYCKMPSDTMDDLSLDLSDVEEVESVEVSDVILGDRECRCETYNLADGSVSNYYFYNESLVRLDQISANGETSIMSVSKISSAVDDSLFDLPKGYLPVNLSKFNFGDDTTTE